MKYFGITLILIISISQLKLLAQWSKHIIDENMTPRCVSVNIADMNGDNKWDIMVTNGGERKIILYQNDFPQWKENIIADNVVAPFASPGDIDGDDTLDVVACLYLERKMVWYENNLPEEWTQHIIAENTNWNDYVVVTDINKDNKLDVVSAVTASNYNKIGDVVWYENNHPTWTPHIIKSDVSGCGYIEVTDVDGDGFNDVIVTLDKEGKVVWYKSVNIGTPLAEWIEHTIDDSLKYAWIVNSDDINKDGKMDIVATAGGPYHNGSEVVWYENPTWIKHVIDEDLVGANFAKIADVDGDGRLDIIAGGFGADDVVWYKNNHPTWNKYFIDADLNGPRDIALEDLDEDGIKDVIVAALTNVVWYKNPYTTVAFGKTLNCFPKYISVLQGDTLKIVSEISNPNDHPVKVSCLFESEDNLYQDSIELFDDGMHEDYKPSDNIFGGLKWLYNLPEDFYIAKLFTTDLTYPIPIAPPTNNFTTAGPIVIDTFTIVYPNDSLIAITDLYLHNLGNIKEIPTVTVKLVSLDSSISRITNPNASYGKIPAGQRKKSVTALAFINKNMTDTNRFIIEIKSSEIHYWTDTLLVIPQHPSGITHNSKIPLEYALHQNYPNPFNPSTTIKYSIPSSSVILSEAKNLRDFSSHAPQNDNVNITLKVYDILGREVTTLVNEKQRPGNYEVEFDASTSSATGKELTSGIYFYQLQTGKYLETKKMLMIK